MDKKEINYQKLDKPLSIRIPHKMHNQYKLLSGFKRKQIQYKFVIWLEKQMKN